MRWLDSDLVYSFRQTPMAWLALAVASTCILGAVFAPWVAAVSIRISLE